MNLAELKAELEDIKSEGEAKIEQASDKQVLGPALWASGGAAAAKTSKKKSKSWFRKLIDGLLDTVRKAICCAGVTEIDTDEERKALADKLLKAVLETIPLPYRLIAKALLKGLIKRAILRVLEYLAGLGDKLCEGISCTLSPLPIK
jgi:hypothetical protein